MMKQIFILFFCCSLVAIGQVKIIRNTKPIHIQQNLVVRDIDRKDSNPIVDSTKTGLAIHLGKRGGRYHWSKNGSKIYMPAQVDTQPIGEGIIIR